MIRKYIIAADDSIRGFDEGIAKLEREWGAEEIEPCEDSVSRVDVKEQMIKYGFNAPDMTVIEFVENLPSVTPQQTRWIPVSERLPAPDEDVLVTNGRGMYIGWIDPTDKGWRVDSESEYFMNDIVAWMPLPQPFKAESEE